MSAEFSIAVSNRAFIRNELGQFISHVEEGAREASFALADAIAGLAILMAPKRSYALAGSIKPVALGQEAAAVAEAPYAEAQEKGAVAHNIPHAFGYPPPFGMSGRFGGKFHPGNPATHFLQTAAEIVSARSVSIVRQYLPG